MSASVILIIFLICMALSLFTGISMIIPLFIGFLMFSFKAYQMGYGIKEILGLILPDLKEAAVIVIILLIIGCMTGIWRQCGTIAYFVVKGVRILPPSMFVLTAFLLSSAMSFALGTSFGVTATCGTIMMAIARAGNVNTVMVAAAVLSGVYVGDRGSPSASSANLVAAVTHTDITANIRIMFRESLIPFIICTMMYLALSLFNPMKTIDETLLNTLASAFNLNLLCIVPALVMVILPFCHVPIRLCMIISVAISFIVCIFTQECSVSDILKSMVVGYSSENDFLNSTLSGGGLISMIEVSIILIISGTYSGLFKATGMLDPLTGRMEKLSETIGRFPMMIIMAFVLCAVFCNQTIGVIMQNQISMGLYGDTPDEKTSKMLDIEDSTIIIAGLVPWCIACSVPLSMMEADARSIPLAFYLWMIPLFHAIQQKIKPSKNN